MKNLTLENDYLNVNINILGAELSGLTDKRDGVEHMWEAAPEFWPRHAPILFPCIGESKGGKINVDNTEYTMARHGFVRNEIFTVTYQSISKLELQLTSNDKTRVHFPFDFAFTVKYELQGNKLIQSFKVDNIGATEMGFQLGGHPAFAVPFKTGEKYDDYEICFDSSQTLNRHLLTDKGLYSGETRLFMKNVDRFNLAYKLFQEDALVFKNISSKQVWIQNKYRGKRLQVDYQQFPHLGIWSIPGADYVCIEPWIGCADFADQPTDFFSKDSLLVLQPLQTFNASFTISIEDRRA